MIEIKCPRCGGQGSREEWRNTGSTCFDCGGLGTVEVTEAKAEEIRMAEIDRDFAAFSWFFEDDLAMYLDGSDYHMDGRGMAFHFRKFVAKHGEPGRAKVRAFLKAAYHRDYTRTLGPKANEAAKALVRLICEAGK